MHHFFLDKGGRGGWGMGRGQFLFFLLFKHCFIYTHVGLSLVKVDQMCCQRIHNGCNEYTTVATSTEYLDIQTKQTKTTHQRYSSQCTKESIIL